MLQWDESLETGDSVVDGQHQRLIAMFGELHRAALDDTGQAAVGGIIERLTEYVTVHFAAEQELMVRHAFPPAAVMEHVGEHTKLTRRTLDMVQEYREGRLTTVLPLATFLQDWIATHIRRYDRVLVDHVRERRAS